MKAAVLSEKSGISGTCSQRITACARFRASTCLSAKVPSEAYTSITGMIGRGCHAAGVRGITRSRHLVIARESCQLHARVDAELREDVAEVAVHGVRRDEEALGNLPVGQPFGDEPGDGELRRRHRRPTARLGFGGDEAASDAELAQAAADAAGVPACSQFRVESEGTAEDVDGGVAIGRGEFGAEGFECGRQLERSRGAFEESYRLAEIPVAPLEQTADVSRRRRD